MVKYRWRATDLRRLVVKHSGSRGHPGIQWGIWVGFDGWDTFSRRPRLTRSLILVKGGTIGHCMTPPYGKSSIATFSWKCLGMGFWTPKVSEKQVSLISPGTTSHGDPGLGVQRPRIMVKMTKMKVYGQLRPLILSM